MKSKLIACILGLSIILSSGTTVLAEAEDASAGSDVQGTEAPPSTPVDPPAPENPPAPADENPGGSVTPSDDSGNTGGSSSEQDPVPDPADVSQGGEENNPSGGTDPNSVNDDSTVDPSQDVSVSVTLDNGTVAESVDDGTAPAVSVSSADSSVSGESEEPQDGKDEDEDSEEEEKKEIQVVGFSGVAEIVVKKKPALKDALAMLPTVVEAVLSDGSRIYVPVDWSCASDYNDKKADRFTFASSLKRNPDGSMYNIGHPIAPGVRFPTASLVIKTESKDDTDEKKDARKESKDPVEEDAPLVMDDVTAANISPDEGEEKVFLYLMTELGINRAAACGVLANIHYESGFNPHAIGDGGTSYGICQWHAGRYLSLVSFCNGIKMPYGSVDGQLKYMENELNNSYPHVLDYLKNVPDTEIGAFDAAYYWCYHFERPAMILRQSTLRGNAAKNSYWPRYKDADLDMLELRGKVSSDLGENISLVKKQLESVAETENLAGDMLDVIFESDNSDSEAKEPLEAISVTAEESQNALAEDSAVQKKTDDSAVQKKTDDSAVQKKADDNDGITLIVVDGDTDLPDNEEEDQEEVPERRFFEDLQKYADNRTTQKAEEDHKLFAF